jgi:TonB-dependent SusC/RagA subfamily outer membrane receptor
MKNIHFIISLLAVTLHVAAQNDTVQIDTVQVSIQSAYGTTIGQEDMNNRDQSSNAIDVIRGRVAGMTVDKSGENAMSAVRLRGTVSLSGSNDPLIIVDGVIGDMSLLSTVNPTDIESFRILKDASETAQFGSRGAGGVIEVTTLKGEEGKLRIHYNGSFSAGVVYKTLPMLSAEAYRSFCQDHGLSYMDKRANTNWQKQITRTSFSHHHHLAFTGGTKLTTYRASIGYINDQYVIKGTGSRSFVSNVNLTQRMWDDVLKINVGMFGSLQKSKNAFNEQKLFYSAACFNPTYPAERNASGGWDGDPGASQIANPMAWLENISQPSVAHLSTNLHLDFKLIEQLHLKLLAAYTYHRADESLTAPTEEGGLAYRSTGKTHDILANMILDYNQTWGGDQHEQGGELPRNDLSIRCYTHRCRPSVWRFDTSVGWNGFIQGASEHAVVHGTCELYHLGPIQPDRLASYGR